MECLAQVVEAQTYLKMFRQENCNWYSKKKRKCASMGLLLILLTHERGEFSGNKRVKLPACCRDGGRRRKGMI